MSNMAKTRSTDHDSILIRPLWAQMAAQRLKLEGANLAAALAEAELDLRTLNNPDAWIPFSAHAAFLEIAARALDDDCFGLNLSETIDTRDAGLIGYLGVASKTVEDGLLNLSRYVRVFSEAYQIELANNENSGTLSIAPQHPQHAQCRQAIEFSYCVVTHAYRQLTGRRLTPTLVHFIHQRRSNLGTFEKYFGCPVKFNRNHGQMVFSRRTLATPIRSSDDRLLSILRSHAEDLLRNRPHRPQELIRIIERRLAELLPTGQGRAKVIATELGMSERTLMRRLGDFNTSFADILESLRKDLAMRYLGQEELSFTHIAFLLGYANQSAFSVACRRWTGRSPREIRSKQLST
jgi:AraC-like DNA-binding protein